jgi:hypothetical protein
MITTKLISGGVLAAAVASCVIAAPSAGASEGQEVTTQSGRVRCWVTATGSVLSLTPPDGAGGYVICEAGKPTSDGSLGGFESAPMFEDPPLHMTNATVDAAGNFSFLMANLGQVSENQLTLSYGQTYSIQGWTILSGPDGTRFTNNATGHGMFVSVENTYAF